MPTPADEGEPDALLEAVQIEPHDADGDHGGGARLSDGDTMSKATRTDAESPALNVADSHDLNPCARRATNNLDDFSVEIRKRRLTAFTGVSGSGKSSLVFGTIAAESQRLINETCSALVWLHADAGAAISRPRRAHPRV